MRPVLAALMSLSACAADVEPPPVVAESAAPADTLQPERPSPPTGARIEPSGYATILSAPPAPPPPPRPRVEAETERMARTLGISVAEAEARMNPDEATMRAAMALRERLRREARGNFIDVRVVRDPLPRYVFQFRRDAAATLARFTSDPRFGAAEGGVPAEELEPLMHEWLERFRPHRLGSLAGIDPFGGKVEIHAGVSRSEYEATAARLAWPDPPPRLSLVFAPEIDPSRIVAPEAAPFIRAFPRADREPGIILTGARLSRIVLVDGCFRVGGPSGPFALFGRNVRLSRDPQGYLAIAGPDGGEDRGGRIGEPMEWGGYQEPVEAEAGVLAIRRHCGPGPVAGVGLPVSSAAMRALYPPAFDSR